MILARFRITAGISRERNVEDSILERLVVLRRAMRFAENVESGKTEDILRVYEFLCNDKLDCLIPEVRAILDEMRDFTPIKKYAVFVMIVYYAQITTVAQNNLSLKIHSIFLEKYAMYFNNIFGFGMLSILPYYEIDNCSKR